MLQRRHVAMAALAVHRRGPEAAVSAVVRCNDRLNLENALLLVLGNPGR